jgi:adenosylcobyric acid synthase
MDARNWRDLKRLLWDEVRAAYDRLAGRFDVIVMEGAGSPAEINLKAGDIVNLSMARHANAPALLVGDIDRGGVFAALAGTMLLLEPEERQQIRGFLINKFRGDPALLGDGLRMLQEKAFGVPALGVIPFIPDLRIAEEDAVALDRPAERPESDAPPSIDIAVIHLPHISNFDDFDPLSAEPGVRVRYVRRAGEMGRPGAVILPGTKATLYDLNWLRARGLDRAILRARSEGAEVVGICGGYQMLGERLCDPLGVESAPGSQADGLGLLPVETAFCAHKQTHEVRFRMFSGEVLSGYEIHAGETRLLAGALPLGDIIERSGGPAREVGGARDGENRVWGTYLHNIFSNDGFRHRWLRRLNWEGEGREAGALQQAEYDRLADEVERAVDWSRIARTAGWE